MKTTITFNKGKLNEEIFEIQIPEFEGSEKQIEWANQIFSEVVSGLCQMASGKMTNENVKSQYDMILAKLSSQKSAKFWIDNRSNNFQTIYKSL